MNENNNYGISTNVLSLPDKCETLNGFKFDPNEDFWHIPDSSRMRYFNFSPLRSLCLYEIIQFLKKTLIWFLENNSASYSNNMFHHFRYMVEELVSDNELLTSIASHHILSYKGNLNVENEWYLGAVRPLLKKWHGLGYPGIEEDTIKLIDLLTLKGNEKGWAVLTMDPLEGPFTELELHAIHQEVNTVFGKGEIGNREFSLVWLFMAIGARPVQISDLKVGDFHSKGDRYGLSVPRAKQRGLKRRSAFKDRPLVKEIGQVMESWIAQIKKAAIFHAPDIHPMDLPLFPDWNRHHSNISFVYHVDGATLSKEITKLFSKLKVHSHRTKELMRVTPQRFRYTLGTRAAMEKQGALVIAELLDHSDTQNVIVYTKATPEIVKILDEALAVVLGRLSNAFSGKIVLEDFDTGRPDDPASLIRVPRLDPKIGGIGKCGTCIGCNQHHPYGCYVCPHFEAWLNGPHEEVLIDLLDERKRKLEDTGDETIAFANDHLIIAVAQAWDMCKDMLATRMAA